MGSGDADALTAVPPAPRPSGESACSKQAAMVTTSEPNTLYLERPDHLSILAGVCREIGLVAHLDGLAGPSDQTDPTRPEIRQRAA